MRKAVQKITRDRGTEQVSVGREKKLKPNDPKRSLDKY